MKRMQHPTIWVAIISVIGSIIAAYIGVLPMMMSIVKPAQPSSQNRPQPLSITAPFDVASYFYPSGWMGDGEQGERYVRLETDSKENARPDDSDKVHIKVSYNPGTKGWAGIFWQYPDANWGERSGRKIRNATKITFWARGETGREVVEFKAGGIWGQEKRYQDTFEISMGRVSLTKKWKKYDIDLAHQDLSNVIGAFAWVATGDANPGGLTFYIDDIRYR